MKKLTTTVFAAVIALALTMPAWAQNNAPAPAAKSEKKDAGDKKGKKASKKKGDKKAADKKAADKK
jgi:hypothetical protein